MKKTLSIRAEAERQTPSDPRQNWGISAERLERLKEHAKQMRRNPTEPEIALWEKLQGQKLGGFKFQRKQVVGSSIVDFACPARWLLVEVDGDAHDTPAIDALRDKKLTDVGLRVLRFTSEEVMGNIDGVLQAILAELQKPFEKPSLAPSPRSDSSLGPEVSEAQPEGLEEAEPQLPYPSGEVPGVEDPQFEQPELQATSLEGSVA